MSRSAAHRDFPLYATAIVCLWIFSAQGDTILTAAETLDIASVPADLQVPPLSPGPPAAGRRVKARLAGYETTDIYHVVYLPTDLSLIHI